MRISREQMLMEMAYTASKRGTCGRLAVGAIIALESRPISLGYVGPPSGAKHCEEFGCDLTQPCTRTTHAEINAIEFARHKNINIRNADMFITDAPCFNCAGAIIDAGILRVYFDREYRLVDGLERLRNHQIQIWRILSNGFIRRLG